MKIIGTIIEVLPVQAGERWTNQHFLIQTKEEYPKKVCLIAWGDKINHEFIVEGNNVDIDFFAESKQFNGRWYTNLSVKTINLMDSESNDLDFF